MQHTVDLVIDFASFHKLNQLTAKRVSFLLTRRQTTMPSWLFPNAGAAFANWPLTCHRKESVFSLFFSSFLAKRQWHLELCYSRTVLYAKKKRTTSASDGEVTLSLAHILQQMSSPFLEVQKIIFNSFLLFFSFGIASHVFRRAISSKSMSMYCPL